ncbi:MAG: hypothetical protein QOG94_3849 [Solirubrobacteraceae bacterium]|nr:hypothetical protein [Solirubrobacteraceae bacterium]MEA2139088.1 hypothetical protein [Solirubrobacteraceae bacterium]
MCAAVAVAQPVLSGQLALVRIVAGPSGRTTSSDAVFRVKSRSTKVFCRRDAQRYKACRTRVKYTGMSAGRHTFVARARSRGRTVFARRSWTILKRPGGASGRPSPNTATPPIILAPGTVAPVAGAPVAPGARKLVLSDEFNGASLDPVKWRIYNSVGHDGFGLRRPTAFALDGQGNLVVTAKMENGVIVSGGMANRAEFTYGRVEFRVRTEPDPTGTMSGVVLTWPQDQNKRTPEFTENDMYETGTRVNNRSAFDSFIHFGAANWQKWVTHDVDPSQWHVIAMEWYPNLLEIYIDNALAWSVSDPAIIADNLHHLSIQLDARATHTLTQPVHMWLDYIRVYQ